MSKYTKGKWQVSDTAFGRNCRKFVVNSTSDEIAIAEGDTKAEAEANAELIAQAPELLAERDALKAEVEKLKTEINSISQRFNYEISTTRKLKALNAELVGALKEALKDYDPAESWGSVIDRGLRLIAKAENNGE